MQITIFSCEKQERVRYLSLKMNFYPPLQTVFVVVEPGVDMY
jgi:hypothetical protein